MIGTESERSSLTGQWEGEYGSSDTGREGTILFSLTAAADSARGEVWMIGRPVSTGTHRPAHVPHLGISRPVESLTIAFVRLEGDLVTGVLDPYRDPETGVEVVTVFRGRLEGDVISGDYTTTARWTGNVSAGWWKVQRKAPNSVDEHR